MTKPFATSYHSALTPLAFQGVRATDCHAQIRACLVADARFLAQRGMPDAATFLAEPVHDASGRIDWYSELPGTPVPLASLPPDRQKAAHRRLAAAVRAIDDLARTYESRNSMTSHMLRLAIQHLSKRNVYVSGDRVVLINWGFAPSAGMQTQEDIIRLGAADVPKPAPLPAAALQPEPKMAAPAAELQPEPKPAASAAALQPEPKMAAPAAELQPEPKPAAPAAEPKQADNLTMATSLVPPPSGFAGAGCVSWLPVLLLLALLAWLLAAIADLLPSPLPAGCFRNPVSLDEEEERGNRLAGETEDLSRALLGHAALCVPPAPEVPEEPKEEPKKEPQPEPEKPKEEPKPEKPEPLAELPFFGAPDPAPEPEPKPAPRAEKKPKPVERPKAEKPRVEKPKEEKPKAQKPARGQAMQIPKDAAKKNDLSFLEGCWRSVTDLYSSSTGRPIEAEYCFQADGRGRRFVYEENGGVCSGSVRASFNGGRLDIRGNSAPCPGGSHYVPQDIRCNGTGTSTNCSGKEHMDGGGLGGMLNGLLGAVTGRDRWKATFVRK